MNNYQVIDLIGQGAYGVVLKAKRKDNGVCVAIKKFKQTDDDQLIKKTTVREIKVLKSLRHKNIVQLKQAFKKKGLVHLVFQYLDNNLLEVLQKNPTGLPNKVIAKYIYQVLEGLQYMHSLNFVHRDIKPENLLVNSQGVLKICDMGFAKIIQDEMTDYVATRWYRPPQLLVGARYGTAIDIWAVGCIMAELSDTQPLFPGANELDQLSQILGRLGQLPDNLKVQFQRNPVYKNMVLPPSFKKQQNFSRYKVKIADKGIDLLQKMLNLDPDIRISAAQALKHPYFDIIRPKRHRFQKTSQAWVNSKNISKTSFNQNLTQRNQRCSQVMSLQHTKQNKQNIVKPRVSNMFFKFGQKKWQTQNKFEDSAIYLQERGVNKIYRRKQSEKGKYLMCYQLGERRPQKLTNILGTGIGSKTNINFKITQKKREKSTYLLNI